MKNLPKTDHRNWYFQSGVHGYFNVLDKGNDSEFIKNVALKPEDYGLFSKKLTGNDKTLAFYKDKNGNPTDIQAWDICHQWGAQSDLFLLWHRVYVYSFENIARKLLSDHQKKSSNFALPYWDYTDLESPQKSVLPTAFYSPKDSTNSLYVKERSFTVQTIGMKPEALEIASAFVKVDMLGSNGFSKVLEEGVHGNVHDEVGNPNKDSTVMGRVPSAAQDPIFWLHHANIDRLWSCWNKNGNKNTPFPDNGKKYAFIQPDGSVKEYSVKDMQTLVDNMDYRYESYRDCSSPTLSESTLLTSNPIKLNFKKSLKVNNKKVEIPIQASSLKTNVISSTNLNLNGGKLTLSDITSHANMKGLYEVYLKSNVSNKEVFVNYISFFGFHNSSDHHSISFNRNLDASKALKALIEDGNDINNLTVVIKPDSRLTNENIEKLNQEFEIGSIDLIINTK